MINLLPPRRLMDMRLAKSNTILFMYIRLIVISIVILGVIVAGSYYFLNAQQQKAAEANQFDQAQVDKLKPYHEQAEDLSTTINTISSIMSSDFVFSDMLTQIARLMPSGAALTGLELSAEDIEAPLVVSAQVDTEQRAAVLLNNLNQSSLFERSQIRNIQFIESNEDQETSTRNRRYNYMVTFDVYLKKQVEAKQ